MIDVDGSVVVPTEQWSGTTPDRAAQTLGFTVDLG